MLLRVLENITLFIFEIMNKGIHNILVEYDIFQQYKGEMVKPLGELQPLPIPTTMCTDICMDFIAGLLKSCNKSMIIVVVNQLPSHSKIHLFQVILRSI
jgi:hypothetical protein